MEWEGQHESCNQQIMIFLNPSTILSSWKLIINIKSFVKNFSCQIVADELYTAEANIVPNPEECIVS